MLQMILTGEVKPGEQLPSQTTLTRRYQVTRPTVRQAYARLINSGHVVARPREGYYVRADRPMTWHMTRRNSREVTTERSVDPWVALAQDAGYRARQTIQVRTVPAHTMVMGERIGDILGLPATGLAVVRDRVRFLDEVPTELAASYYPYDLVRNMPAMLNPADIQPGIYPMFAAAGHDKTRFVDAVRPRIPSPAEANLLELEPGSVVLEMLHRSFFTPDDECLLVRHSVYAASATTFVWEVTA